MNRLLFLIVGMCAAFVAVIVAVRINGAWQPSPDLSLVFANPDGTPCQQPCLFGIQPGKTTYDDAVLLLQQHPLTRDYPHYLEAQYSPDGTVYRQIEFGGSGTWVYITSRVGQPIDAIQWRFVPRKLAIATRPYRFPTFGDAVRLLGHPESLVLEGNSYAGNPLADIGYFGQHMLITSSVGMNGSDHLTTADPINLIALSTDPASVSALGPVSPWIGFTSVQQYRASTR